MSQNWLKISVTIPNEIEEAVSNYLFELGASGVVNFDDGVEGYFEQSKTQNNLQEAIIIYVHQLSDLGFNTNNFLVESQIVENKDWNAEWKKNFKTTPVTDNIIIKPSWEPAPAKQPKCLIEIDPGMAFGTGTHETTILMLRLLEKNILLNCTVLDIGTGTGILAIAALKLGAKKATAFDVDPLATDATQENSKKNKVANNLNLFTGILSDLGPKPFDMLLANVNKTEILKIVPVITTYMHNKSKLLLSGLLATEESTIVNNLEKHNLQVMEILPLGEWIAIHAKKTAAHV
jgi:ribosomal protein L11 methyltransferase